MEWKSFATFFSWPCIHKDYMHSINKLMLITTLIAVRGKSHLSEVMPGNLEVWVGMLNKWDQNQKKLQRFLLVSQHSRHHISIFGISIKLECYLSLHLVNLMFVPFFFWSFSAGWVSSAFCKSVRVLSDCYPFW